MNRAKIGDVEISVVSSERPRHSAESTDKPLEKGQDVSDHTKIRPPTVDIIGAVVGDDASDKLQKLRKYQKEGTLVKYIHRNAYDNIFITDIATTHDVKIRNGYEFNISLKQLRIVAAKEVEIKISSAGGNKAKTQVKPKTNNGLQQPQEKPVSPVILQPSRNEVLEQASSDIRSGYGLKAIVDVSLMKPPKPKPNIASIQKM